MNNSIIEAIKEQKSTLVNSIPELSYHELKETLESFKFVKKENFNSNETIKLIDLLMVNNQDSVKKMHFRHDINFLVYLLENTIVDKNVINHVFKNLEINFKDKDLDKKQIVIHMLGGQVPQTLSNSSYIQKRVSTHRLAENIDRFNWAVELGFKKKIQDSMRIDILRNIADRKDYHLISKNDIDFVVDNLVKFEVTPSKGRYNNYFTQEQFFKLLTENFNEHKSQVLLSFIEKDETLLDQNIHYITDVIIPFLVKEDENINLKINTLKDIITLKNSKEELNEKNHFLIINSLINSIYNENKFLASGPRSTESFIHMFNNIIFDKLELSLDDMSSSKSIIENSITKIQNIVQNMPGSSEYDINKHPEVIVLKALNTHLIEKEKKLIGSYLSEDAPKQTLSNQNKKRI